MAISIDAEFGGASANSYVTIAEADTELEYSFDSTTWTTATDDDKTRALVMAARKIDSLPFYGTPACETQRLEFPRYFRDTVYTYPTDLSYRPFDNVPVIPENVKKAQILEANEIIKTKSLLENERTTREDLIRQGVKWVQLGENIYERYEKSYLKFFASTVAEGLMMGIVKTSVASE